MDCKRQELSSTAFVHCSISKAIFSIINIHLFLGTPTSGHPNLCTSKHYFVTEIEFVRNRPKRADVPIWRKSDLSRKLWICNAFTLTLKFSVNAPHRKTLLWYTFGLNVCPNRHPSCFSRCRCSNLLEKSIWNWENTFLKISSHSGLDRKSAKICQVSNISARYSGRLWKNSFKNSFAAVSKHLLTRRFLSTFFKTRQDISTFFSVSSSISSSTFSSTFSAGA